MTAIDDGWVHPMYPTGDDVNLLARSSGIDIGEATAIQLARAEKALLHIDDKMGQSVAEILGVRCLGTVGLFQALAQSVLQLTEFKTALHRMINAGLRLDSKIYRLAMEMADDIAQK
ncbi:MAG: hypothetical protein ACOC3C_06555 [Candidatus Thorarchaeota archaeon]